MKLVSWNINGLRACLNKGGLEEVMTALDPDIVCLQEIKAQPDQVDPAVFGAYEPIWNPAERKGYSGTMILSRTAPQSYDLNFPADTCRRFELADQFGDANAEGRLITAEFDNFYLVTVYTPNSKGDLSRLGLRFDGWDPAFARHCRKLAESKPVLMCGDLNVAHQEIDLARPKENVGKHGFTNEERRGFDNLLEAGFVDTFRHLHPDRAEAYSWWTHWGSARAKNVGWRIDYWLASGSLAGKVKRAAIHADIMGSDHCPVSLEVEL
ncbi:exodeoxyribonuclease III [Candidatus Saccharibacteria bacterium]|nr:exodeoxyribonuclease III [Candidatus Saccharibacteria bacterium]